MKMREGPEKLDREPGRELKRQRLRLFREALEQPSEVGTLQIFVQQRNATFVFIHVQRPDEVGMLKSAGVSALREELVAEVREVVGVSVRDFEDCCRRVGL